MCEAGLSEYLQSLLTPRRRARFEEVLARRSRRVAVILENVAKSHNFSAVLRSCDCFGVQDVWVADTDETFDVNRQVTLGADKWVTVHQFSGRSALQDCVSEVRDGGYEVLVTSPHGESRPMADVDVTRPTALIFGSEQFGVSEEAEALADGRVHIPMYGFTESLNVSVAAAVSLSDLARRVRQTPDWQLSDADKSKLRLAWARRSITSVEEIEQRWRDARTGGPSFPVADQDPHGQQDAADGCDQEQH